VRCRRCLSPRLRRLARASPQDHRVLRCEECSFIFSPPEPHEAQSPPTPPAQEWPLSWEALARMLAGQGTWAGED